MHALEVLGDPVRRHIAELLVDGERSAGDITDVIRAEHGISQPAVSQHLRVLRESGLVQVRAEGTRRLYAIDRDGMRAVDEWVERFRQLWTTPLEALATEVARGKRARRTR